MSAPTTIGPESPAQRFWSRFTGMKGMIPMDAQKARSWDFATEVQEAVRLLDFLIDEPGFYYVYGQTVKIRDEIIRDIEHARETVAQGGTPTEDDVVKFLKAKRDLVAMCTTSVTFEKPLPTVFWGFRSPWFWVLVLICVVPSICLLWVTAPQNSQAPIPWWPMRYIPWWSVLYGSFSGLMVWAGYVFTGVVTDIKLNQLVRFCYVFTLVALGLSLVPFCLLSEPKDPATPISVMRGCVVPAEGTKGRGDLTCAQSSAPQGYYYQWVVNIGGVAGSADDPSHQGPYKIRGGLVVPVYIIVLALFGSAVSMTRRVPDFQRRALSFKVDYSNGQARADLVSQIMQVLAAPLIAVTAYYVINPDTESASVALGFVSGFSSDPILRTISGWADKIQPSQPNKSTEVGIKVEPPTTTLLSGEQKQFTATVDGTPNKTVKWQIQPLDGHSGSMTDSGLFTAPNVTSEKAVTITATSEADPAKSASATVKITP